MELIGCEVTVDHHLPMGENVCMLLHLDYRMQTCFDL